MLLHRCMLSEYRDAGSSGRRQLVEVVGDVPCLITPMSAYAAVQNGYTPGRAYEAFFQPDTDVKVGQRITWKGKRLMIGGLSPYEEFLDVAHIRATCTEDLTTGVDA